MIRSKISEILEKIDLLKKDLYKEYESLKDKYHFKIIGKKVLFTKEEAKKQKKYIKEWFFYYIITASFRNIVSAPFIYIMIIPAVILDIFLIIYQFTAFPLYKIERVKRSEHFIYDRRFLKYLNVLQKINCLYCSYVNWLFSYAAEVWWRTEKYWCPIKHALKNENEHKYYKDYADYWDAEEFNKLFFTDSCFKK
ncbi:MAG: hypothetical protein ACD_4C00243G0003 [uncultured bacterium (gcode 4)]|uniref:Uncharacterized protein n=1 Tax=uncultured bacterium (gcode 4) TaxID=1234023 RepID=K2G8V3_9BACT|nr:MAG: hypothetical protein ACD_4C00243G0003 [uncultured bacterium (gcode 4)]